MPRPRRCPRGLTRGQPRISEQNQGEIADGSNRYSCPESVTLSTMSRKRVWSGMMFLFGNAWAATRAGGDHDQPHRLEVAEPFLMHTNLRVDRHRCYPVTGQR